MKQTVDLYLFRKAFESIRPHNFSYEGLEILFNYFEAFDENLELDVIAICCDFTEADNADIAEQYDIDVEGLDENDCFKAVYRELENNTIVVGSTCDGRIIYANY